MPYLRLETPAFSLEQKKIMAAELTDAVMACLNFPHNWRERIIIHFTPYQADDLAVGGRLASETEEPIYRLGFFDAGLSAAKRKKLTNALMPVFLELLGLGNGLSKQVQLLFFETQPEEWSTEGLPATQVSGSSL